MQAGGAWRGAETGFGVFVFEALDHAFEGLVEEEEAAWSLLILGQMECKGVHTVI